MLAFAIAVRLLSLLLAFWANTVFPLEQRQGFTVFRTPHAVWDTIARYDSGWYFGIARFGYRYVEGGRSNLAFFPGYPLLMRTAGQVLGGGTEHYYIGGALVSWVAFVVAMVWLFHLARREIGDEGAAFRAVIYAATFPFAFFFGVAYSEATYLAAIVGAFLAAHRRRWVWAGTAAAVAVLTRVNGVFVVPALMWLAWRAWREPASRPGGIRERLAMASVIVLPALAFAGWCAYVYALSGSPLEWKHSIERWQYHPGGMPWAPFATLMPELFTRPYEWFTTEPMAPYDSLNALAAAACVVAIPFVWRRFGFAYAFLMIANLWLPLSSGVFEGLGRYCAVLFPLFLLMATWKGEATQRVVSFAFPAFYFLAMALFTTLHPIF